MQQTPPQQQQFSLQNLQQYIVLKQQLTGVKPKEIEVSKKFLDWYQEQIREVAKNLNIPTTKNFKEPKYLDVKLIAKLNVKK